ncbi:MAG: hypothetical protein CSA22_09415 [Deltaproteobacteria bacterium]|nr:MAG: hypothetical protein CSA22_09415 [Deltaproteobacteria bacterium]
MNRRVCDVLELKIQRDHVYLVVKVPPKISISNFFGYYHKEEPS